MNIAIYTLTLELQSKMKELELINEYKASFTKLQSELKDDLKDKELNKVVNASIIDLQEKRDALNREVTKILDTLKMEAATQGTPPTSASPEIQIRSYSNFDLHLSKNPEGQLLVQVFDTLQGGAEENSTLPSYGTINIKPGGLIQHLRDAARVNSPNAEELASSEALQTMGEEIGRAMLPDGVRLVFKSSLDMAKNTYGGLRIRLHIKDEDVADVPWEAARFDNEFLGLRRLTPIVRYIVPGETRVPMLVRGPLRVLGIVSDPKGLPRLNASEEKNQLENAIRPLIEDGKVHLEWLPNADPDSLLDWLRHGPHILHYIGHSSYESSRKAGTLWFKNPSTGEKLPFTADWLAQVLKDSSVCFVFLNACESGRSTGSLTEVLVRRGIPAALGMQTKVLDKVAIAFAVGFYKALADRYPVDLAVVEGRKAIINFLANDPLKPDWAEPILHMSALEGQLFKLDRSA